MVNTLNDIRVFEEGYGLDFSLKSEIGPCILQMGWLKNFDEAISGDHGSRNTYHGEALCGWKYALASFQEENACFRGKGKDVSMKEETMF